MIPYSAHRIVVKVDDRLAVYHLKNIMTKLRTCDDRIVGKSVSSEKCLAARPFIIIFGSVNKTLPGGEGCWLCTCIFRKLVPVRLVEDEYLCGFCRRIKLPLMVLTDAASFDE